MQIERCLIEARKRRRLHQAGQLQKHVMHILAKCLICREQAVVRIDARRAVW